MLSRVLVILFCVPVLFVILNAGDSARLVLFSLVSGRGQFELFSLLRKDDMPGHPLLEYVAGTATLVMGLRFGADGILAGLVLGLLAMVLATVLRGLGPLMFYRFALGLTSLVYLPFCLAFFLILAQSRGGLCLFGVLASIWALDIGAYLVGCTVRGPKLAPQISPNKTISGAIGGTLACLGTVYVLQFIGIFPISVATAMVFGTLVSIFGQVADLFESAIKRETGVKDTSSLFAGHGGMLDRLDSVVFLGPISWFFFK